MNMKRIYAWTLALVMVISLAACNGGAQSASSSAQSPASQTQPSSPDQAAEPEEKVPHIGIAVFDYNNTFVSYIRKGIENYCADGRATVESVDAANDQTKQNEQISILLAKGVDVLIVNLVDVGAGDTVLNMAKEKDVPVIFVNRPPYDEVLTGWDKCWYVGIGWKEPGYVQAQLVLADWQANQAEMDKNGDGVLQYVVVQGNISHLDAINRTAAYDELFGQWNGDGAMQSERLDIQEAGWSAQQAKELMDTWAVKYGDQLEAIVSNNDAMAMGIIESLRANGFFGEGGKTVKVYGINAIPEVIPMIEAGEMSGTVLTSPWLQAMACIDIAVNVTNGREPLAGTDFSFGLVNDITVENTPVTAANLDQAVSDYENCN